ncbi:Protein FecR [uncultured Comamonas sp.]|nr:Protein FecR [uncultured Comamonas sp.]
MSTAHRTSAAAGGTAISEKVALQAAEWFFLLQDGKVSAQDHQRCQRWRAAHPAHEAAWQKAQQVGQRFAQLPPSLALTTLNRPAAQRRAAAQALAVLLLAAPAGWLAWRQAGGIDLWADYRSATGERREVVLADGSSVQLDTASAIDVHFDSELRLIRLCHGAIHVQTAADPQPAYRPFVVATEQGRLRALGTRFTVRQDGGFTRVAVFEGAVEMRPADSAAPAQVLQAGQQAQMGEREISAIEAVPPHADGWTRGVLQVRNMRLDDFAAELARYRPGIVRCDPAVAGLRISGAFQLRDTTPVLDSLPQVLPVAVRYRTRYWATLTAPGD